ncbi:unnamed protein product, partial [Prorocentrum cordatum]
MDLHKAFDSVLIGPLIEQALDLGFPMRLVWMCISYFRMPRVLQAYGSWSRDVVANGSILAGCAHCAALLTVLLLKAAVRLRGIAEQLTPRSLMDDLTMQWIGQVGDGCVAKLRAAVQGFTEHVRPLGMQVKMTKSGWLATSQEARKEFRPATCALALPERRGLRNLGHDAHGAAVRRPVAQARMAKLQARQHRVDTLVSMLAELRHRAAMLCSGRGGEGAASIAAYLATQEGSFFDPVHEATAGPVAAYAAQVWDGHLPLARPQQAWAAPQRRWADTAPTWRTAREPLAVAWMSLRRIGWDMHPSPVLLDDERRGVELLRLPPLEVRKLARDGVARWQGRQILSHRQAAPPPAGARVWMRGARHVLAPPRAKIRGPRAGHLRTARAGGAWDAVRRHEAGYIRSPYCPFCVVPTPGTWGHWFYECERVAPIGGEPETGAALAEMAELQLRTKQRIRDRCHIGLGDADYDRFDLIVGLPIAPHEVPAAARVADIFLWDDWALDDGIDTAVVFPDGSGHEPATPELTLCGWAIVQLDMMGLPRRAAYGALPGARQT